MGRAAGPGAVGEAVSRLTRRLNTALALGSAVWGAACGLTVAAAFLLYTRAFDTPAREFTWLAAPICLAGIAIGILIRWRRFYTATQALALLDRRLGAQGLLLAIHQAPNSAWVRRADAAAQDRSVAPLHFKWGRLALRLLPFVAFLVLVLLVPPRLAPATARPGPSVVQSLVRQMEDKLDLLAEEELLPEERLEEYRKQLDELKKQSTRGIGPRQWEAMDSLNDALSRELQQASSELSKARSSLAQASNKLRREGKFDSASRSAAREKIKQDLDKMKKDRLLRRLTDPGNKALGSAEKSLAGSQTKDPKELDKDLLEALRDLDREDLAEKQRRLEEAARRTGGQEGEDSVPDNLDDYKMSESEEEAIPDFGGGDDEGADGEEGFGEGEQGGGGSQDGDDQPGSGGINRGRGDAPMGWKSPTSRKGAKFKATPLPPGWRLDRDGRLVFGVSTSEPEPNDPARAVAGAARAFDKDPGKVAWKYNISPRNRGVLKKYFSDTK